MAFGSDDLLWVLGGAAYVADGAKKAASREKSRTMSEFVQKYICENTDVTLEREIGADVANPQKYEEVWERIERYHRENPISGWSRRYKGSSIICTPQFPKGEIPHNFSVKDIGKCRLYFWSQARNKRAYNAEMDNIFYDYQEIAITLLMWTYGKETRSSARKNAEKIYRIATSR